MAIKLARLKGKVEVWLGEWKKEEAVLTAKSGASASPTPTGRQIESVRTKRTLNCNTNLQFVDSSYTGINPILIVAVAVAVAVIPRWCLHETRPPILGFSKIILVSADFLLLCRHRVRLRRRRRCRRRCCRRRRRCRLCRRRRVYCAPRRMFRRRASATAE